MTWSLYRWVWRLEAPVHIGMPPAGALNRTRLYVPARAVWGAMTAELARRQNIQVPDYKAVGQQLQVRARFGYLFPAQKVGESWYAWLPEYREDKGLVWTREDGKGPVEDRVFRRWLLTTRPGTAIAPTSDTAEEGTLREHEVINPFSHWGEKSDFPQPVALAGYLCLTDDGSCEVEQIEEIFIGGDTRYGLGRLKREVFFQESTFFGRQINRNADSTVITTDRALAHTITTGQHIFTGALELVAGWDAVSGGLTASDLAWAPGSKSSRELRFQIGEDGLWRAHNDAPAH